MNRQQQDLHDLLSTAQADLEHGRPAERTAHALKQALGAASFDDLTRGEADDERWRITRIPTRLEDRTHAAG